MKVAIYARYSSENQSEKSIDDQVRVCRDYIRTHDMSVEDRHIYVDEAISGSIVNRPALQSLQMAAENKEFEAVVVDDLSRLSRSNHQMLTMVLKFNYLQIKIVSVSDGIITDDENSKLGIHLRGLMNELYLDDLKKKTMRGLEGQKLRGFSVGERVYGYSTQPVGELKFNKKGQAKYEGKVHKINPGEADIVRRIYREFIEGKSLHKIVRQLNLDKVPTKKGFPGGWNISSVSKILKNERYIGRWTWKKSKGVRDPLTGKRKSVTRPENEWLCTDREDLIIIDKEQWKKAQTRWRSVKGTWPVYSRTRNKSIKQQSYVHSNPIHLLSGLLRCQCCGGAIILISGKGNGYYGCFNARRKTCDNGLLVPRKRIEMTIITDLKEKILTLENLRYVYKKVEKLVSAGMDEVPDLIKKKKAQYEKSLHETQNYLNYIKMGNFSKTVSEALKEAEVKSEDLGEEINSLEFQKRNTFKAPPKEWIKDRLENLHETLDKDTCSSALALKDLLGTIQLEPISEEGEDFYGLMDESFMPPHPNPLPQNSIHAKSGYFGGEGIFKGAFKPYYIAHTKIQTLALLDDRYKGANWSRWWSRRESNP
ncbi:recombinase family protein [Candidatus Omnitrophota bacterium]